MVYYDEENLVFMRRYTTIIVFIFFIQLCQGCTSSVVSIFPTKMGAKGDGKTDDSKVFQSIFEKYKDQNLVIDGQGLRYALFGELSADVQTFTLKNIKIRTGAGNTTQVNVRIKSNNVVFDDVEVTGDRSSLSKEHWKLFSNENGVKSIMPSVKEIFFIEALDTASVIRISGYKASNLHTQSALLVRSFGQVHLNSLRFDNLSNKGYHVYHVDYKEIKKGGSTVVKGVTTNNTGILPPYYYVENKKFKREDGHYMPQESFNCIVSFGNYSISDAVVSNYGSIGVTSDRNQNFVGENITVSSDSRQAMSNNPSAGIWFECSKNVVLKNAKINISARSPRDLVGDNSALHIFAENSTVKIEGVSIASGDRYVLNKGIRGSFSGENNILFDNVQVKGNYKQGGVYLAGMQNQPMSKIALKRVTVDRSNLFFYQLRDVDLTTIRGSSGSERITYLLPENPKKTGKLIINNSNLENLEVSAGFKNLIFDAYSKSKVQISAK